MDAAVPHLPSGAGARSWRQGQGTGRASSFQGLPEKEGELEEPVGREEGSWGEGPQGEALLKHAPSGLGAPAPLGLHTDQGTDGDSSPGGHGACELAHTTQLP